MQAAEVAPIVDQGWLLGGFSQGKWLTAEDTAKALKGGETYQLCTVTRFLGRAQGSKPKRSNPEGVMPEFGITFKPSPKSQGTGGGRGRDLEGHAPAAAPPYR